MDGCELSLLMGSGLNLALSSFFGIIARRSFRDTGIKNRMHWKRWMESLPFQRDWVKA